MTSKIPLVQTTDKNFHQFQTQLGKSLQPILKNPINYGVLLKSVALVTGQANAVSHTLNRTLQGWLIVRQRAQAQIWDSQDSNSAPDTTLLLHASANVTVDLWVF